MSTSPILYTYQDVIDHLLDWLGVAVDDNSLRQVKSAILSAYRELPNLRNWSYYYNRTRLNTVADYSTGTITYDHTGGSSERLMTLASGTWPTWAEFGVLKVGSNYYSIASRDSATQITLNAVATTVAAGTAYELGRPEVALDDLAGA